MPITMFKTLASRQGWTIDAIEEDDLLRFRFSRPGGEFIFVDFCEDFIDYPALYEILSPKLEVELWCDTEIVRSILKQPAFVKGVYRPIDEEDYSVLKDEELIKYLCGCRITWYNTLADQIEMAVVPERKIVFIQGKKFLRTNPNISISRSKTGRRIFTFPDSHGGGFRSMAVSDILESRKL